MAPSPTSETVTMFKYTIRRVMGLFPILFGISFFVFLILHLIPGDPAEAMAGLGASGEAIERIRKELGLDKPLYVQYFLWLSSILRGNLGRSVITHEPIAKMISFRLLNTLKLAIGGISFAVITGILIGVVSAVRHHSIWDYIATVGAIFGISMPVFWIGLMLMLLFSIKLKWLPAVGMGGIK
ncbi:MAG TPA: ABC transporter permease, partial [Candidatus Acetothermia bacterium]|nr:ABC transporter permease [Candidatus Acetothermia bacterium]